MTVKSTISAQRELAQQALDRIGYGPDSDLASFSAGQRKKIEKSLDQIRALDAITTQGRADQIGLYGERAWVEKFERLSDFTVVPGSRLTGEKLQRAIWAALPDCMFKRFQEAFCEPGDRIVPKCSVEWINGERRVSFDPKFNPGTAAVLPCIVSPSRLSEDMLSDLGIADFSDLTRSPIERLKRKSSLPVVTTLKHVWDSAAPLREGELRILIIGKKGKEAAPGYESHPVPEDSEGKIFSLRRLPNPELRRLPRVDREEKRGDIQVQVHDTPGSVLRRMNHIFAGYDGERSVLQGIDADGRELEQSVNNWTALSPAERQQLHAKADKFRVETGEKLERSSAPEKVDIGNLAEKVSVVDKTNRENPGSLRMILGHLPRKLDYRLTSARKTEEYIKGDEALIKELMLEADQTLLRYVRKIRPAGQMIDAESQLFSENIEPLKMPAHARRLITALQLAPRALDRLDVQPYRAFGGALESRFGELKDAIVLGDREGAKDALLRMHVVGKLFLVVREVERMKIRIARDPETTFEVVRNAVSDVLSQFDERDLKTGMITTRLFAERQVPGLEEPFNNIRAGLREVLAEVNAAGIKKFQGDLSPQEEAQRISDIRERLDEFNRGGRFDIMAVLKRLP